MKTGGVALLLSALALGAAVVALTRGGGSAAPERAPARTDRVDALERQVAEMKQQVEALRAEAPGRRGGDVVSMPSAAGTGSAADAVRPPGDAAADDALTALVETTVDRKTEDLRSELRAKQDRKPPIDVLAAMLELTDDQRVAAERVVVEGQRELHRILNLPAADGSNLMDELVEIAARALAEPGRDHGWTKWLGRLITEKVPGTDTTYAAQIEALKGRMRAAFQRDWSEAQYKEYLEWGVDPTEIKDVPGSPNVQLIERIHARARMLGAEIPAD